jgi:uroporphyrinogen-III synthase
MAQEPRTLEGRTIAIPETREIDIFAAMLERRGATVLRCPMVAILDAPDPQPILQWCGAFAQGSCDDLILLTGEGLRRLLSCIDHHEPALRTAFVEALARARKITRGPKPARALRDLGLKTDIAAETPTTEGVIASLSAQTLSGRRVGVQLYGTDPNTRLIDFLKAAGAAVLTVAPYVYADAADDEAVRSLIARLEAGHVDAIAFTSTPQVERLFALESPDRVKAALSRTLVAAVGPIVANTLTEHGVTVQVMPSESFFLKPMTSVIEDALSQR